MNLDNENNLSVNEKTSPPPDKKEWAIAKNYFFIKKGNIFFKVKLTEIDWINSERNYCTVISKGKKYPIKTSLKKITQQLPKGAFFQIHKSYVVRMEGIESLDFVNNKLVVNNQVLPLGRSFKGKLQEILTFLK